MSRFYPGNNCRDDCRWLSKVQFGKAIICWSHFPKKGEHLPLATFLIDNKTYNFFIVDGFKNVIGYCQFPHAVDKFITQITSEVFNPFFGIAAENILYN